MSIVERNFSYQIAEDQVSPQIARRVQELLSPIRVLKKTTLETTKKRQRNDHFLHLKDDLNDRN